MSLPDTLSEVLVEADKSKLYADLIQQFNKDMCRANISVEIPEDSTPEELVDILTLTVSTLIERGNTSYQNLLYAVDVPDYQAKKFECLEDFIYTIVRREWQKVWYRNQYSQR